MVPGGVASLPISGVRVLLDRAVADMPTVYCGMGRTNTTLENADRELVGLCRNALADLTKSAE